MNTTNNFAITSQDAGEILMRSASSLSAAGVDMSEALAMGVAANETVQSSEKVGNALKSLAVNLQGVKTNAKDGTLEMNKTALALKRYANIDIVQGNGELKDTFSVLSELSTKWADLNEETRAGLSEAIAGK